MAIIPYSDVIDRRPLPIDAQDVVTKVRLVIVGQEAGIAPWGTKYTQLRRDLDADPNTGEVVLEDLQHFPDPLVFEYEAPEHATYGAARSFALPEGINPFLPPEHPDVPEPTTSGVTNPGLPSVVRDGDPLTFATITNPETPDVGVVYYAWDERFVGWSAHVAGVAPAFAPNTQANTGAEVFWEEHRIVDANETAVRTWAMYALPTGNGSWQYSVFPGDARGNVVNGADGRRWARLTLQIPVMQPKDPVPQPNARIYAFYPLILNEDLLLDIARAQIRLPAQTPQRVTVRGYVPPDREHTITGWPGGDYTGAVAQHQYELGRTIIDFEQAGSPAGLPAEAIEAARERRQAIEGAVQVANYNLKMGSRR